MSSTTTSPRRRGPAYQAVERYLRAEVTGGIGLLVAAIVAIAWANSPGGHSYQSLWATSEHLAILGANGPTTLLQWVNTAPMSIFFLVIGLELGREWREGALRNQRTATLPIVGAVGGMIGAGVAFALASHGSSGAVTRGWGVPMATDIAFVLGILALLGHRVPSGLRLLLLTLAIADDIGGVIVLATLYAQNVDLAALGGSFLVIAAMIALRRKTSSAWPFLIGGLLLWGLMARAGVEPALSGVVIGVIIPSKTTGAQPVSSVPRLENRLHHVSSIVVLPVFALANAGVVLRSGMLQRTTVATLFSGILLARVVGKFAGVFLVSWLAIALRITRLPEDVSWLQLAGGAALTGMGFTVPLLAADVAFAHRPDFISATQLALLVGSLAAGAIGITILLIASHRQPSRNAE